MANTIRLKSGSGSNPSASDLVVGEVALRTDGNPKLFTKNDAGSVLEVGLDSLNSKLSLTGGTLTGTTTFANGVEAVFGTGGSDGLLKIKSDAGGNSYITEQGAGDLTIQSTGNGVFFQKAGTSEYLARMKTDAEVELYYDGSKKFETVSGGAKITGTATATGSLIVGSGNDLQFTRSGGNTEIQNYNGTLLFGNASSNLNNVFIRGRADENSIVCIPDGSVELYNNGVKTCETTNQGIKVTGTSTNTQVRLATAGGTVRGYLYANPSNEVYLLDLQAHSIIKGKADAQVELFYDNAKKFQTTSGGISITGDITGTGHLDLGDDAKLKMGASDDLEIFHSGGNSFIANSTGYLLVNSEAGDSVIRASNDVYLQPASGEFGVKATANGSTELYYDNSKKLETTSTGTRTTGVSIIGSNATGMGSLNASTQLVVTQLSGNTNSVDLTVLGGRSGRSSIVFGDHDDVNVGAVRYNHSDESIDFLNNNESTSKLIITSGGNLQIPNDNAKLQIGASQDLQLYHDGSHSFVQNTTGLLILQDTSGIYLRTDDLRLQSSGGSETYATLTKDGAVSLNFDNSTKFATTSTGVTVTSNVRIPDGGKYFLGTGDDMYLNHSGSHGAIANTSGNLYISTHSGIFLSTSLNESAISANANGSVELYYNNAKKFETTSSGVSVTGFTTSTVSNANSTILMLVANMGTNNNRTLLFKAPATDSGSEPFVISTGNSLQVNVDSQKTLLIDHSGQVNLHHDGSTDAKLSTSSTGVSISGTCTATTFSGSGASLTNIPAGQLTGTLPALDGSNLTGLTVNNANTLDNLDSTQFVRSDTSDTLSGTYTFDSTHATLPRLHISSISGSGGYNFLLRGSNDGGFRAVHFVNGTTRSADGGANTYTIRNDGGALRLGKSSYATAIEGNGVTIHGNGTENAIKAIANGSVELYYDNSKKFETTSTGASVTGALTVGVGSPLNNNVAHLRLADSSIATPSNQSVLLVENNTNAWITIGSGASNYGGILFGDSGSAGRGQVRFNHNGDIMQLIAAEEKLFQATLNGASELYYDNSKKLETFASGLQVTGRIEIPDGSGYGLRIGDSSDLQIYHSGSHSFIDDTGTGDMYIRGDNSLKIQNAAGSEQKIVAISNGAVELYYDNSKKFETHSGGTNFHGTAHTITTGDFYPMNDNTLRVGISNRRWAQIHGYEINAHEFLKLYDNVPAKFGNGDDLQIYHDGSHSYITEVGTGHLYFGASGYRFNNAAQTESIIQANQNGAVELYYDNSKKFETTSEGIQITSSGIPALAVKSTGSNRADVRILATGTGDANLWLDGANGDLSGADYAFLRHDNNLDLKLVNYGGDISLRTRGGTIGSGNLQTSIQCNNQGSVELYHAGYKKFETSSTGGQFFGKLHFQDGSGLSGANKVVFGDGEDLQIYHDGNNSVIAAANVGDLQIFGNSDDILLQSVDDIFLKPQSGESGVTILGNGTVSLFYDNSEKLYTTADGIESKGELHFKSPSNFNGEQTGRIEWWNENDAGVMAKIGVDRKASTGAPADLVFSTSQNVDTSANGSDGDITERGRFSNNGLRLTNQPCFYAYSNVTRNNYGGGLVVAYTATHHNQGNHYSTSTYRFTAPVDGIYIFGGNPGYVETGRTYSLYLRINGAVRTEVGRVIQGNFPSHSQFGFSVSVKLSANDYVDLYQLGRMHHNAAYSAWWGYFLG